MADTATWFYAAGTDSKGPFSFEQMRMLLAAGILRVETLVWTVGMADWVPVRQSPLAQAAAPVGLVAVSAHKAPQTGPDGFLDSFLDAVGAGFANYITFSGRAQRAEYWFFFLFSAASVAFLAALDLAILGRDFPILATIFIFVVALPCVAALVRRLHDVDRSGWWALLVAIPVIGDLALLVLCALPGSRGANRFG